MKDHDSIVLSVNAIHSTNQCLLSPRIRRPQAFASWKIALAGLICTLLCVMQPALAEQRYDNRTADPRIIASWNDLALDWIRQSERGPTISSRLSAYVNIAMYDAWATFSRRSTGILSHPERPDDIGRTTKKIMRNIAISQAAHRVLNEIGESILTQEFLEIGVGEDAAARLAALQQRSNELLNRIVSSQSSHISNHNLSLATAIADQVADTVNSFAVNDGANQLNGYSDTSGYSTTPWAFPVPTTDDGISDYDFLNGYSFTAFDPVAAESVANPGYAEVNPSVANGSNRLTQKWQGLTELGVFPPADDGGQAFPLTPHWGELATFALNNGQEFRPDSVVGPYLDSGILNPQWVDEARQLVTFAASMQDGEPGSALQRARSEYWELGDATEYPPGWWVQRASDLIAERHLSQRQALKLLLAVSLTTYESSIAAWDTKYAFDTVRPISAVNELFYGSTVSDWRGDITAKVDDRDHWRPYQLRRNLTPPFPDIVSGHSTFSTSAATVLMMYLGSNYFGYTTDPFISRFDLTDGFDGNPDNGNESTDLSWKFLSLSAEEAGLSRLYGGIHMMEGNIKGLEMGTQIGHRTISYINSIFGDWRYRPPQLIFGSGNHDELYTPDHACGHIELYGFHDPDTLRSDLNCFGIVRLFGGEGMDSYTIGGRGWVRIRDYETGELIEITQSRLDKKRHYSGHGGTDIGGHRVRVLRYYNYSRQPSTVVVVDGRSVVALDGSWQLDDLNLQFVQ